MILNKKRHTNKSVLKIYSDDDHGFVLLKHNNAPAGVHIALGSSFSCHICWTGPGLQKREKNGQLTRISYYFDQNSSDMPINF